jgi:hypothetical protein
MYHHAQLPAFVNEILSLTSFLSTSGRIYTKITYIDGHFIAPARDIPKNR